MWVMERSKACPSFAAPAPAATNPDKSTDVPVAGFCSLCPQDR